METGSSTAPLSNGTSQQSNGQLQQQTENQSNGQSSATTAPSADARDQAAEPNISADEIALYDRQIRLWGVKAQEKIRTANILLIGMKGLATEVAKNLVLAGIGSLTVVDDGLITEDDLGAQFFVREEHVGQNRAQAALPQIQKLNPRVKINIATLDGLFQDSSVFGAYSLIIATDMSLKDYSMINAACRVHNRPLYTAGTHGMYGYIFVDLISHDFVITRAKSNIPTKIGPESSTRSIIATTTSKGADGKVTELVTKRETYTPLVLANTSPLPTYHMANRRRKANVSPVLSCFRALWDYQSQTNKPSPSHSREDLALFTTLATAKHGELLLPTETLKADVLRSFLQNAGSELSPVCAFLGGQLAQDVINVIGGKEQPIQNILIFDGEETKAPVYALHSDLQLLPLDAPLPMDPIVAPMASNGMDMSMMGMPMDPTMSMTTNLPMMLGVDMSGANLGSMQPVPGMLDGSIQNLPQIPDGSSNQQPNPNAQPDSGPPQH